MDGVIRAWSATATRVFGYAAGEIVGRHASVLVPDAPLEPGTVVETRAVRADGSRLAVRLSLARGEGGALVGRFDADPAEEREERAADLLERATRALTGSLDLDATLASAAAAFVPGLAELCVIFSLEPDGATLRLRAADGADPEVRAHLRRGVGEERPFEPHIEGALITGRRPYLHGPRALTDDPALRARLGDLWRTALPLRSRDGVWGLVVLGTGRPPPRARPP